MEPRKFPNLIFLKLHHLQMGKSKEINGLNDKMLGTFLTPKAVISESRILHLRLVDILLFFLFCFQAGGFCFCHIAPIVRRSW